MPASPMPTSSPGYAILNDLRRSMGTSSSQPMPTPSRGANASTMVSSSPESRPHLSPNMDDVAASQQLMNEGARANPTLSSQKLSQIVGAHDKTASARKKRKKHRAKATQQSPDTSTNRPSAVIDEFPTSSPFPFPATQPEAEEITRAPSQELRVLPAPSGPSHAVEVPDSQTAATHMGTPASPPRSSYVVPSSATKSKKTYKKSRQAKRDRIVQDVLLGETVDELADTNMGTQDPPSPSHPTTPHKRQRVGDASTRSQDTAVDVAPGAAKRRKIGTPKSATTVQDLIHTSSNDDEYLQQGSKTRLKRVKKPHTPVTASKNIYDIPDDESDLANRIGEGLASSAVNGFLDSGNGGQSDDLQETLAPKKNSVKKKKKSKSGGDVYHWAASMRKPGQPLSRTPKNEQYNGDLRDDPISSDDGDSPHPPAEDSPADGRSEKKKQKEKSQGSKENKTPHPEVLSEGGGATRYRRSIGRNIIQIPSAERALNTVRNLGHPPDLRENGDYTNDEEELIRRAIKDYQQRKGLEVSELVEIIQWNQYDPRFHREPGISRNKSEWTPQDREDMEESTEFWDEIKSIGLRRSHERVRRHIRQLYHQFKSGAWTEEDDEQLRNLQAAYPNQWKLISISMGDRSMHDCVNRWRDYLQYGNNRKTSRWTKDEEDVLTRAVTRVVQRDEDHRAESGRPRLDVYANKDISWPQVAREMGNTRSRIQASVKWAQMMRRSNPPQLEIEYKPRTSTAAQADISTSKKRKRRQKKDVLNESGDQAPHRRRKLQIAEHADTEEKAEKLEKQVQDEPELATGSASRRKHHQPNDSDDEPQSQARANNGPIDSSPPKTTPGQRRKSEATESDKPQKRRKRSAAREESESREAEGEQAEHETSDSYVQNETNNQGKERAEESEREEVGGLEEYQTLRGDVEEDSEKQEDEAALDEAEEGQKQEGEEEQGDEAIADGAPRDDGQDDEAQVDEVEEKAVEEEGHEEGQDEAQDEVQDETSESSGTTHDSKHDASEVEVESGVESEVGSATALPEEHGVLEGSAEPGVDQMLWGDKYDLIFKLLDRRDEYEEEIDWEDVRKDQAYPWSEETLKAALGQLIQLIRDRGREVDADDFPGTVDDVMDLISEEHAAELEEHYSRS